MTDLDRALKISGMARRDLHAERHEKPCEYSHARLAVSTVVRDGLLFSEVWLGSGMISLGIFFLRPYQVYPRLLAPNGFSWELVLALWMILIGALRVYAVFYQRLWLPRAVGFCSLSTWLFLFYLALGRNPELPSVVLYIGLALKSLWIFWRLDAEK